MYDKRTFISLKQLSTNLKSFIKELYFYISCLASFAAYSILYLFIAAILFPITKLSTYTSINLKKNDYKYMLPYILLSISSSYSIIYFFVSLYFFKVYLFNFYKYFFKYLKFLRSLPKKRVSKAFYL